MKWVLLHFSSWLWGDSYCLLVCLSKDGAVFWQTASLILFIIDDRKILYSHQEIGNYLKYDILCHLDMFLLLFNF